VKITAMNVVTVLDFGLAKALPDSLAAAVSSTVSTVVMRIFAIGTSRQLFPTSGVPHRVNGGTT